jgi:hypothetical protein
VLFRSPQNPKTPLIWNNLKLFEFIKNYK